MFLCNAPQPVTQIRQPLSGLAGLNRQDGLGSVFAPKGVWNPQTKLERYADAFSTLKNRFNSCVQQYRCSTVEILGKISPWKLPACSDLPKICLNRPIINFRYVVLFQSPFLRFIKYASQQACLLKPLSSWSKCCFSIKKRGWFSPLFLLLYTRQVRLCTAFRKMRLSVDTVDVRKPSYILQCISYAHTHWQE